MRTITATTYPAVRLATKQDWHTSNDLSVRNSVLLHIFMLLKSKYGTVDSKISLIGRRAELALYNQAFSAWEYHNPQTLGRRLYSLVLKLHLNNLTAIEEAAFTNEMVHSAASRKRTRSSSNESVANQRTRCKIHVGVTSPLFFDGNCDLQHHVCSFLDARDVLQCAATCTLAAVQLPAFVTRIQVTTGALMNVSPASRSTFFQRFPNLQNLYLSGRMQAQQLNYQDEQKLVARNVLVRSMLHALSNARLPKLTVFSLTYCYTEGLESHITRQIATVLLGPSNDFPQLRTVSLVGNCITDDGVLDLYTAIASSRSGGSRLAFLDLAENFLGERSHIQMHELVMQGDSRGAALIVNVLNNLWTATCPQCSWEGVVELNV